MKCSNCGREVEEGYSFCKYCGAELSGIVVNPQDKVESSSETSAESEVTNTIIRRFDGIKNRDENVIKVLIDESYNKFDDWPPYTRQEDDEALKNEFSAFKVLSNYDYKLKDLKVDVVGGIAIATFSISYQGIIRGRRFDIASRVTSVLRKQGTEWKIVHEHFSRFPDDARRRFFS